MFTRHEHGVAGGDARVGRPEGGRVSSVCPIGKGTAVTVAGDNAFVQIGVVSSDKRKGGDIFETISG